MVSAGGCNWGHKRRRRCGASTQQSSAATTTSASGRISGARTRHETHTLFFFLRYKFLSAEQRRGGFQQQRRERRRRCGGGVGSSGYETKWSGEKRRAPRQVCSQMHGGGVCWWRAARSGRLFAFSPAAPIRWLAGGGSARRAGRTFGPPPPPAPGLRRPRPPPNGATCGTPRQGPRAAGRGALFLIIFHVGRSVQRRRFLFRCAARRSRVLYL